MNYLNEVLGGVLIGVASAIPLLYEGRIAGISGYAASVLKPKSSDGKSGLALVIGLVIGGFVWRLSGAALPTSTGNTFGYGVWALAGLLVGFGSRLGGGCTSGHGVCGLGRLSFRSLVSVLVFMTVAILTTILMRSF